MKSFGPSTRRFSPTLVIGVALALGSACAILYMSLGDRLVSSGVGDVSVPAEGTDAKQSPEQEMQALQMHLQTKPGHTPILFRMAQLSREMGKTSEAAEHLREILRLEPGNLGARLELGRALYEMGDVDGAVQETKTILEQEPRHVDALYNLGAIYANLQNNDLARQYWTQAVNSDPQSESGQNAQRGLRKLGGSSTSLPSSLRFTDSFPRTTTTNPHQ
jgi:cytochrome c-type biogenesis protein CcmH/NrfG